MSCFCPKKSAILQFKSHTQYVSVFLLFWTRLSDEAPNLVSLRRLDVTCHVGGMCCFFNHHTSTHPPPSCCCVQCVGRAAQRGEGNGGSALAACGHALHTWHPEAQRPALWLWLRRRHPQPCYLRKNSRPRLRNFSHPGWTLKIWSRRRPLYMLLLFCSGSSTDAASFKSPALVCSSSPIQPFLFSFLVD